MFVHGGITSYTSYIYIHCRRGNWEFRGEWSSPFKIYPKIKFGNHLPQGYGGKVHQLMGVPVLLRLGPRDRIRISGFYGRWFPITLFRYSQNTNFENIWVPTVRMSILFFSDVAGLSTLLGWSTSVKSQKYVRLLDLHKAFKSIRYWWISIQHQKWLVSASVLVIAQSKPLLLYATSKISILVKFHWPQKGLREGWLSKTFKTSLNVFF